MALEDFEWEGDVTSRGVKGEAEKNRRTHGESAARRWLASAIECIRRARHSIWLEPALRLLGMGALLGVLSVIGVLATRYARPGQPLPVDSRVLPAALGAAWLKPTSDDREGPAATSSATHTRSSPAASAAAPETDRETKSETERETDSTSSPRSGVTADGKVILNVASVEELTRLPGVGRKRAEAIAQLRTKLKRFKSPTDLLRVKGIGPRGLKRMLPHLVLDAPSSA